MSPRIGTTSLIVLQCGNQKSLLPAINLLPIGFGFFTGRLYRRPLARLRLYKVSNTFSMAQSLRTVKGLFIILSAMCFAIFAQHKLAVAPWFSETIDVAAYSIMSLVSDMYGRIN